MNENTSQLALYFLIIGDEFKKAYDNIEECPCSLRDMKIIQALSTGEKTMSQLAEAMSLTAGSMTSAVDSLIKDKLVKREYNKEDRRRINIVLTKKGNNIAKLVLEKHYEISGKILETLEKNEQDEFLALLQKITKNLSQKD